MLKLTVIEAPPDETPVGATKLLGPTGGTVGRTQDNAWTLTDEDSLLSRCHFEIVFEDGAYTLIDKSTNGSFLNDAREPLGRGNRAPIQDGDTIRLGGYRIEVAIESVGAEPPPLEGSTPDFLRGADEPIEPVADVDSPVADNEQAMPGPPGSAAAFEGVEAQPLADSLFGAQAGSHSTPEPSPPAGLLSDTPPLMGGADHVSPAPKSEPAGEWPARVPSGSFPRRDTPVFDTPSADDKAIPPSPPPADDGFALHVPVADQPASPADEPGPGASEGLIPDDWWVEEPLLDSPAAPPDAPDAQASGVSPGPPPIAQPVSRPGSGTTHAEAARESTTTGESHQPGGTAGDTDLQLRRALRPALGTHADGLTTADLVQVVEELAAMAQVSIPKMMQALGSRTEFKDQLRLDQTMVRPRDNNPLKFCASAEEAQQHMLLNDHPGLLRGRQAMDEGFHELATHQSALVGALPAALRDTINHFSPAAVESAADNDGVGTFGLGKGKTRLWDTYRELYTKLAESDQGALERVFMKALAQYYERSLRAMK